MSESEVSKVVLSPEPGTIQTGSITNTCETTTSPDPGVTEIKSSQTSSSGVSSADISAAAVSASESNEDGRACEEICIVGKRTTLVSDAEVQSMLSPEGSSSSLPARIQSLRVEFNRNALLPASTKQLQELQSLSLHSCSMELIADDGSSEPIAAADRIVSGEESNNSPPPSSQLTRSNSGLRALKQLHTLELVHDSPPPLSSAELPNSLQHLRIDNYPLSDQHFFTVQLENLRSLSLLRLKSLPGLDSVGLLKNLEQLTISRCPALTMLPESLLSSLPLLSDVDLSRNSIFLLPETLDELPALRSLNVEKNKLLVLPRVFATLRERGVSLRYDEQLHKMTEENNADTLTRAVSSTAKVEEVTDDEVNNADAALTTASASTSSPLASAPSSATAAAVTNAATPSSSKSKRKLGQEEHSDSAEDGEKAPKHARSAAVDDPATLDAAASAVVSTGETVPASSVVQSTRIAPKRRIDQVEASAIPNDAKRLKDDPAAVLSFKYFQSGELSWTDRIVTGFFDCGRHSKYFHGAQSAADFSLERALAQPAQLTERETMVVDFDRDVRLKQIMRQARQMSKQIQGGNDKPRSAEELQMHVKLIACLVSDSFGGRVWNTSRQLHDQNTAAVTTALSVDRTSPTLSVSPSSSPTPTFHPSFLSPLSSLSALCHSETGWWRRSTGNNCVLLASVQHGLCRHRSLLMKILCDEFFSSADVRCKLVRGFREGGIGHAWNVVWIRGAQFIVDCLDSPMLFRPLASLTDPAIAYYPQYAEASSYTADDTQQSLATFHDLYLAQRGKLIGEGSYSQVFECRLRTEAGISQPVALKVTQIAHLSPAHLNSLLREVRLLPQLQHPNIVRFYAYLISQETLNIWMRLVRGANLDIVIKTLRNAGQRLSVEDILVLTLEIARGVHYLHQQSTLHRDLKSAQVLIGHSALTDDQHMATPFRLLPSAQQRHPDRSIVKVKRTKTQPAPAATPVAAAAASTSTSSSILPPPLPNQLSFFSSASVLLCDFNIAVNIGKSAEEDLEEEMDDAAHAPILEYVGTLRWCAPEVFQSSQSHSKAMAANAQGTVSRSTPPSTSAASASTTSSATTRRATAAERLEAGRRGDVWSFANVLLELLSLHLPYEDIPTEEELNGLLMRGERSNFQQWLDPNCWPDINDISASDVSEQAMLAWSNATEAHLESDMSVPSLRRRVYQALVGLYLHGTRTNPEERPTMESICHTLTSLHDQMMNSIMHPPPTHAHVAAAPVSPTITAATTPTVSPPLIPKSIPVTPPVLEDKVPTTNKKHARDRSTSPHAIRSARTRFHQTDSTIVTPPAASAR
jgi:serine/threonine protein kinase